MGHDNVVEEQKRVRKMKKYILAYSKLIIFFYVALVLVFIIPAGSFRSNIDQVDQYIDAVGGRTIVVMNNEIAVLDTYTDARMYQVMEGSELNALKAALDINGYARYWHGYLIVLRPLAAIFEYDEIRFLLGTIIMLLFALVTVKIHERVGICAAITHAAALALTFFTLSAFCLQYVCCYIILFLGELLFLRKYNVKDMGYGFFLLFTLGMVTNYFDFLTYPIVTLGGVLLLMIYTHYFEDADTSFKKGMYILIKGTLCWGLGYVLTWVAKWILATLILGENVLSDALEQAAYRSLGGNDQGVFSGIILAVRKNLGALLMDRNGIILAVVLICSVLIFLFWTFRSKNSGKALLPIALISLYPYIWYCILAQHSIQHAYFTYKAQMITLWVILLLGAEAIQKMIPSKKENKNREIY